MLKIYFIPPPYNSFDFELELNNIYKCNPDKIICFCLAELDYEAIFGEFFDKAQPWLVSKNKIINLIINKSVFFQKSNYASGLIYVVLIGVFGNIHSSLNPLLGNFFL